MGLIALSSAADSNEPVANLSCLAAIIESSDDAIISYDLEGTILTWNRGAAGIYGYAAEEVLGQSVDLLIPQERAQEGEALLARIRAGQRVQHFETVHINKNGAKIQVCLTVSPILDDRNHIIGASHVARDISERVRLEIANAQLEAIIESSDDAIISKDLNGTIQTWNAAAERIYGYQAAEAIGRNMKFLHPPAAEWAEDEILEKVRRGKRVSHFETLLVKKGGSLVPVSLTISPIRDRAGAVIGASHASREIGEQRRLQAANAQLAAVVESCEDAIVSKDLNGIIKTWNASAERIYGYSAQEAIGCNIAFLLPPSRINEEQEILSKLRNGERVEHFETSRLRKDGTLIDVSLSISPIREAAGAIIGASHVARDITEQKHFQEELRQTQRLESVGVLAGGIAHDFNNLLTGIIGNASLVSESLPPAHPARDWTRDLLLAAGRAADLTRQMLAYAGKGQFLVGPVNISALAGEISPLLRASIPKNVTIRLDLEHDLPPVEADQSQIQQLIMNMIINGAEAVDEHRAGMVVVKTGAQQVDEQYIRAEFPASGLTPGEYVYIEIRDNGCGMDEETKARIFDPFFTTKFTGRGLGLAAALGIVTAHRGAIRVYSIPGEGTTFKVLLPVCAHGSTGQLEAGEDAAGKGTVLVVDDEEIVRSVAKVSLENQGYRVLLAGDGQEAVDLFSEMAASIALIVLDLTMPVMGGEEALGHLRAIRPDVPIILSSGHTREYATSRFRFGDLDGFLQKPYTNTQLRDCVDTVLGAKASNWQRTAP